MVFFYYYYYLTIVSNKKEEKKSISFEGKAQVTSLISGKLPPLFVFSR